MKLRSQFSITASALKLCLCTLLIFVFSTLKTIHAQVAARELLPAGGQFPVGHVLIDWVDASRMEPATSDKSDHRQVVAEIWYPARVVTKQTKAPYYSRLEPYRSILDENTIKILSSVQTLWLEGAAVDSQAPFGVVVFSHGWSSRSTSYGTFLSNLASHGYIVVGVNHPHMGSIALSNGRVTNVDDMQFASQEDANHFYASDVSFVLDQLAKLNKNDPAHRFTGNINMSKVVGAGHSSGFPAVSEAAVRDKRIKGLMSFDAGVPTAVRTYGLAVPLLLFRAAKDTYTDLFFRGENVHPKGTIYDVDFFRVHRADFYDLVIDETTHTSVLDEYLFTESESAQQLSKRNHKLIERFAVAFLQKLFQGKESTILNGTEKVDHTKLRLIRARRN